MTRVWIGNVAAPEQCTRGYLCAFVEGNSSGYHHTGWWEFKFYYCGVYNLAYWHEYPTWYGDDGSLVLDDQTGGVTTKYYSGYNGTGTVLQRMTPRFGYWQYVLNNGAPGRLPQGWNPVNSIRVC